VALLYYPFGNEVLLVIFSCALTYVAMLLAPNQAGIFTWCIAMPFLLLWYDLASFPAALVTTCPHASSGVVPVLWEQTNACIIRHY
jgi:hypothetical protein